VGFLQLKIARCVSTLLCAQKRKFSWIRQKWKHSL